MSNAARRGSNATRPKKSRPRARSYASDVRAQAKEATHHALVEAALALFGEQGLDVPIDAICARAGYSRGAFYAHFGDRDALIVAAMRARREATFSGLLAMLGDDVSIPPLLDLLGRLVGAGAFPSKAGVRSAELLLACRRSEDLRRAHTDLLDATTARLADVVRSDQRAGVVRRDVDAHGLAAVLVVLEAGVELMADLGWSYDVNAAAAVVSRLVVARASKR